MAVTHTNRCGKSYHLHTDRKRGGGLQLVCSTKLIRDDELLELAGRPGGVMATQDIRFRVMAEDWQRQARSFAVLFSGHQQATNFGRLVADGVDGPVFRAFEMRKSLLTLAAVSDLLATLVAHV